MKIMVVTCEGKRCVVVREQEKTSPKVRDYSLIPPECCRSRVGDGSFCVAAVREDICEITGPLQRILSSILGFKTKRRKECQKKE